MSYVWTAIPIVLMIWGIRWVLHVFMKFLAHSEG